MSRKRVRQGGGGRWALLAAGALVLVVVGLAALLARGGTSGGGVSPTHPTAPNFALITWEGEPLTLSGTNGRARVLFWMVQPN